MKKYQITVSLLLVIAGILFYLQFGRDIEIISTTNIITDQSYTQSITAVANKLIISDPTAVNTAIWESCRKNTNSNFKLSYDIAGKPDKLAITVYPNKLCQKLNKSHWTIIYDYDNNFHEEKSSL